MRKSFLMALAVGFLMAGAFTSESPAQTPKTPTTTTKPTTKPAAKTTPTKTPSKFDTLTKGMKKIDGMWTMYHNDQKLYVALKSSDLSKNYIVLTSIARGVSSGMVLGGMSWGFGDDVIWTFKKVGEKIHVIHRNVRFRAKAGTTEADAVKLAYSDSVLYALSVLTTVPGGYLVDMSRIFMSDDQQIGRSLGGARFASDRSTWAKVKAFPKNVELQVAAVYSGARSLDTVVDARGMQVNVHYSISLLPSTGYKSRMADDRVGYFMTVLKDFSNTDDDQHFVRYINRWDLQKLDPKAKISPPKEPIVFYLEKTVPVRLRPIVRDAIEEWNKAYEKLGFDNAIEVRQQRNDDTWDPEDVRYNTFRWITAEAGFAMGPSRVNPMTGQILDADIIFDASFLRYWKQDYETFTPADARALMREPTPDDMQPNPFGRPHAHGPNSHCLLCKGMQQQMGFAAATLMGRGLTSATGELPEAFTEQALKEVVMHEVGHTLGLRHNFKASSWKTLNEMNDPAKGAAEGTVASVMDYSPANIAPKGVKQGLYYSTTIGPYDYWAIEYGYKQVTGDEKKELKKIASRSAEKGLDYATDEDTSGYSSDPLSNRFDLGKNPIAFAARQIKISNELLPQVIERSVKDGEGYQRARQAFGMLFSEYWRSARFAARYPGGVLVHRDHKGDKDGRAPFEIVDAKQQRAAMKLLSETVFGTPKYDAKVLNHLAATRWSHWGMRSYTRLDYSIHDYVSMMQSMIVSQLFDSLTLSRLQDGELKVAENADSYTLAEHLRTLVDSIFTECKGVEKPGQYTNRKPYVSSFRRNLQRMTLKHLAALVTSGYGAPEDARTLARMHLGTLDAQITALLGNEKLKLDDYSRAHLLDSQKRIQQVLNAQLNLNSIN